MFNPNRQFDILLFYITKDFPIGDTIVKLGWNQMIRKDNSYFLRDISQIEFYTEFPTSFGHLLAKKLFKQE